MPSYQSIPPTVFEFIGCHFVSCFILWSWCKVISTDAFLSTGQIDEMCSDLWPQTSIWAQPLWAAINFSRGLLHSHLIHLLQIRLWWGLLGWHRGGHQFICQVITANTMNTMTYAYWRLIYGHLFVTAEPRQIVNQYHYLLTLSAVEQCKWSALHL